VEVAAATNHHKHKKDMRSLINLNLVILFLFVLNGFAQTSDTDTSTYKKRVLESIEVDFLASYYSQDGDNAAVSGGIGTEELTDLTSAFVVSVPLNDDDVLTIDAGISAYTSASSSNINPFDDGYADPFVASSGASSSDVWINANGNYSHSSDDRNQIVSGKLSISSEYDYFSVGVGGSFTKLFNEKNTELSINANIFIDTWKLIYPYELRPFLEGGAGLNDPLFTRNTITGNPNYQPLFSELNGKGRNSYAIGLGFSQILSKKLQGTLSLDLIMQTGLLSTPFQRVYFDDMEDSFIDNFHLADDVEQLPDKRIKTAIGGRLNYYINEIFVVRTFYRYYMDDWGITSQTASIELPIKIADKFTLYPSYRYYYQTAADYFAPYEEHLSTDKYYTSDYDLSKFSANQYGFGMSYTDVFTKSHVWKFGLKSIDLKYAHYSRDSGLTADMITGGFKFVME